MTHEEVVEIKKKAFEVANAFTDITELARENEHLKAMLWRVVHANAIRASNVAMTCTASREDLPDLTKVHFSMGIVDEGCLTATIEP